MMQTQKIENEPELEMTENDVYRERTAEAWSLVARPHARGLWARIATGDERTISLCLSMVLSTIARIREVKAQISHFSDPSSFPEQKVTIAGKPFVIPRMPDDERAKYLAQLRPELARQQKHLELFLAGRW